MPLRDMPCLTQPAQAFRVGTYATLQLKVGKVCQTSVVGAGLEVNLKWANNSVSKPVEVSCLRKDSGDEQRWQSERASRDESDESDDYEEVELWHASFRSKDSMHMLEVANAIVKAGGEPTVVHVAQRSATWLQTWMEKAEESDGVVIIYSDNYREEFTEALQQEAAVILQLYRARAGKFRLFIYDPAIDSASDVRANIQDEAPGMGDIDGWVQFVTCHEVTEWTSSEGEWEYDTHEEPGYRTPRRSYSATQCRSCGADLRLKKDGTPDRRCNCPKCHSGEHR